MSQTFHQASQLASSQYRLRSQAYWHADDNGDWRIQTTVQPPINSADPVDLSKIRLISWNIDFMAPYATERMAAALQYLDHFTASSTPGTPIVLFLQEMTHLDLKQIREAAWVKQRFNMTDFNSQYWRSSGYGTTTLVDRRLQIQNVFRVPFYSGMNRDGLLVDIALTNAPGARPRGGPVLRLCNTHLESLVADPPFRPIQMAAAAEYLSDKDDAATKYLHIPDQVACGLLAGDLNAIQPFDRTLHLDNGLSDTYLELGGEEDSDEGYTWGPQAQRWSRERFGCSRMDKILFRGDLLPLSFERIGVGVKVAGDVLEEVEKGVEGGFVTDHYGVMGDFELTGDLRLVTGNGGQGQEPGSSRV
jgi:tyrosyl-DNA phosphodiesterase 2